MKSEQNHYPAGILQEYTDGVLSGRIRSDVTAHLATCDSCRRSADAFRRIDAALRTLPRENAGDGFTRSVMETIGSAGHVDAAYRLLLWAGAAVGAIVVGGVVMVILVTTSVIDFGLAGEEASAGSSWSGSIPVGLKKFGATAVEQGMKGLALLSPPGGMPMWVFALAVVGSLFLADFLLHRRMGDR